MAQITQSFTPEIVLMFRVATEPDRFKTTPGGAGTHGTDRDTADTGTRGPILLPQFTHDSKAKFSLRNPSPDSPHCGTRPGYAVPGTADEHREHFNNREGPTNRLPVGSYSNRILLVCGVPASRGSGVVWRVSLEYYMKGRTDVAVVYVARGNASVVPTLNAIQQVRAWMRDPGALRFFLLAGERCLSELAGLQLATDDVSVVDVTDRTLRQ